MTARVSDFESQEYWEHRYSNPELSRGTYFDWYLISYSVIRPFLLEALLSCKECCVGGCWKMMDVGCGNSSLLRDMYEDKQSLDAALCRPTRLALVGVDYSEVVVSQQRNLVHLYDADAATVSYAVVNLLSSIGHPCVCADVAVAVDKATLDCIDCTGKEEDVLAAIGFVHACLVPAGVWLLVTCRATERRVGQLEKCGLFAVEGTHSLQNDPISPAHLIVARKIIG